MARNRDPFSQALSSLRERIQTGLIQAGAPVIVVDEAQRLRLSPTPVREALARLSGENMVIRASPGGYFARPFNVRALTEFYLMREQYLRFAVETNVTLLSGLIRSAPPFEADAPNRSVDHLFRRLVCDTGNELLSQSYQRIDQQLFRAKMMEARLFTDLGAEARSLFAAYEAPVASEFTTFLAAYHRRRVLAAAALASMVNEPPEF